MNLFETKKELKDLRTPPNTVGKYFSSPKNQKLKIRIIQNTQCLPEKCKITERIFHILNGINQRPTCKYCESFLTFRSIVEGYLDCANRKCINKNTQTPKIKKQINQSIKKIWKETQCPNSLKGLQKGTETVQKRRYEKIEKAAQPLFSFEEYKEKMKNNGVIEVKYQCKKCNNIFIGNLDADKLPRCPNCFPHKRKGYGFGGFYEGIWCASSWELAWVFWAKDNNINFERNWKWFPYSYKGKPHKYFPDFYLKDNNCYIEIKNNLLLSDPKQRYKIEHFDGDLELYNEIKIKPIIKYVEEHYGKNFTRLYQNIKKENNNGTTTENATAANSL